MLITAWLLETVVEPSRSIVPVLVSPAALKVLVALRLLLLVPTCTVAALVLVSVPPTCRLLPPLANPVSSWTELLFVSAVPALVVIVAPFCSSNCPPLPMLPNVASALLLPVAAPIATTGFCPVAPFSFSWALLPMAVIAPEPKSRTAAPDKLYTPVKVEGAAPAMFITAWLLETVVEPSRSIVPLLVRLAAVRVLVALRLLLLVPTCTVPPLVSVPPTCRLLPPLANPVSSWIKLLFVSAVPALVVIVAPFCSSNCPPLPILPNIASALLLPVAAPIATTGFCPVAPFSFSCAPVPIAVTAPEPKSSTAAPDKL